jgi:hypothetical protein
MKKIIFTLLLGFSVFTLYATSEFKREITKDFPVGANPSLSIENKYGNIRIIEGSDSKIMFKIEITGKGKNETLAQEYAESVSIDFSQSGDRVSAKTELKSISCDNCGREIHYTVIAPKSVTMNLTNKYGNITLDNVIKPLNIDLKYGDLSANSLDKTVIDLKYGKINIQDCNELKLDSKYSSIKAGTIGSLIAESKYDGFQIGTITDFKLETGYTNVKISKLNKSFVAEEFKYCSLDISEIATGFSKIKIDAAYTNVKLNLNESHSFKTNLYTKYGHIKTGKITFNSTSIKKEDALVGIAGKESNPNATIDISLSYGNISF